MNEYGTIIGAYILVDPDVPMDVVTQRALSAGLHVVLEDKNKPKPTTGKIVALGNDPHLVELGFKEGLRVSWNSHMGERELIKGKEYRLLAWNDVRRILPEEVDPTKSDPELPST